MDRLSPNIPEAIRHNLMSTPPGFLIPKVTDLPVPKTEKATLISERGLYLCRQLPTLPHTFACSTIGPAGLNFRVRDGIHVIGPTWTKILWESRVDKPGNLSSNSAILKASRPTQTYGSITPS